MRRGDAPPERSQQLRIARHEPGAHGGEAMPGIELIERAPEEFVAAGPARDVLIRALAQARRQFRHVPAADGDAALVSRVAGAGFEHVQPHLQAAEAMVHRRIEPFIRRTPVLTSATMDAVSDVGALNPLLKFEGAVTAPPLENT